MSVNTDQRGGGSVAPTRGDLMGLVLQQYPVCGVRITAATAGEAAEAIVRSALSARPYEVHLCNAYTLSLVDRDPRLREVLDRADLNLADGAPVAWLGRRRGQRGPVRGPSLMRTVVQLGVPHGLRHFLYGGAPGVANQVASNLRAASPGSRIVGFETPPYTELSRCEAERLADRIGASEADVVWVGVGTPRQDYLVPQLASLTDRVVVPVGAAFDFIAGRVSEAPDVLHGSGLEWIYRLSREPHRLVRRYLVGNPRFVWSTVRHKLGATGG